MLDERMIRSDRTESVFKNWLGLLFVLLLSRLLINNKNNERSEEKRHIIMNNMSKQQVVNCLGLVMVEFYRKRKKKIPALVKWTQSSSLCFFLSLPVSFIVSSGGVFVSGPGPA